jgi:integrase
MAHRRSFGYVHRRRDYSGNAKGTGVAKYKPGWYVRLRIGRRTVERFAGTDRATAVEFANRLARQSARQNLLGERAPCELLLSDFAEQYLKFVERTMTPLTAREREKTVRKILIPFFGTMRLDEITRADVERFLAERAGVSGATRNRNLACLGSMYRRARDLGLVEKSPVAEVKRSKEPRLPLTIVDEGRLAILLSRFSEPMHTFFLLLLDSGLRLGEAIGLVWDDVDFEAGSIVVRVTKAKRPRLVAMTARLVAAMRLHLARKTVPLKGPDYIFPGARGKEFEIDWNWRNAFKRAAKKIGFPRLRIHDLRHMFAVSLVRRGVDLPTVQAVLGHTSLLSTLRYAEYADGSAAFRAARALDAMHAAAAGGASDGKK